MLISPDYIALNRELHERGEYGLGAHKWAPVVDEIATQCNAKTILDYGSGQGTLRKVLETRSPPYEILEYDPAIPGKEHKPLRADMLVCCDVLEHVEPECLYSVLDDMRNIARLSVLLVVATRPAKKILSDGRNAHLIIEPSWWWLPKIIDRWHITLFKALKNEFVCVGTTI